MPRVHIHMHTAILIAIRQSLGIKELFLFTWFRRLVGIGKVTLTSAPQTVQLVQKSTARQLSLRSIVEQIVVPVKLNPFIFNGHLQTLGVALGLAGPDCAIHYKRKLWQSDNEIYPGQFSVDFVIPPPAKPSPRDRTLPARTHDFEPEGWDQFILQDTERPLVIVLHGFLGGSHEKYVRHALDLLSKGGKDAEFSIGVMNQRGCSYTRLTSPVLYHPNATWDLRQLVKEVRKLWPNRRLFAVGFSIGANLLCNYLGDEGDSCEFEAAILIGNPWNLDVTNSVMASSTLGLHLYQRALGGSFRRSFERHLNMISQIPDIDIETAKKSKYLWQWDRYVQCPTWGYPSETSMYRDTSSADAVAGIKIPTLILHAKDDPVCIDLAVPYHLIETNPYLFMCATSIGGHLGWFELGGGRWSNTMIHSFLKKIVNETVSSPPISSNIQPSSTSSGMAISKPIFSGIRRKLVWPAEVNV